MLLWLWCRRATAAPIRPLAWGLPYAVGMDLKKKKKKIPSWFATPLSEFVRGLGCFSPKGTGVVTKKISARPRRGFDAISAWWDQPWLQSNDLCAFPDLPFSECEFLLFMVIHLTLYPDGVLSMERVQVTCFPCPGEPCRGGQR